MSKFIEIIKKNKISIAVLVFLCPFLLISTTIGIIRLTFLITGLIPENLSLFFIKTDGYSFKLNDYLILFIYFLQTVVTALFSYFLWKTSLKSNQISEELKDREINKEKEILKENALIVYYDLLLGVKDLKKLFDKKILNKNVIAPKRLYFSNEWIKNVAILKEELTHRDINTIYELYGDLLTIKDLLENNLDKELDEEIKRIFIKIADNNYVEYMYEKLDITLIQAIVNMEYQHIFEKLKKILFFSSKSNKDLSSDKIYYDNTRVWYQGNILDGYLNGSGKIYNEDGRICYEGTFEEDSFKNGIRREYYSNGEIFFELKYENGIRQEGSIYSINGKLYSKGCYKDDIFYEGYRKIYNDKGNLEYEGEIKNNKYHGNGIKYDTASHKIEGIWDSGRLIEGIEYGVLLEDYKGNSWEADYHWEQQQIELHEDENYCKYEEEGYLKAEEENAIGWEKYGDIKWTNGNYKIIQESKYVKYLQEG